MHIIFFVFWLGITIACFLVFGESLFYSFPLFLFFSGYVAFFIAVPVFYYGKQIAKWEWRKIGIGFVLMLVAVPIATWVHIRYLNVSEENALHEFITSVDKGDIPKKFTGYDPEDARCLANYITPEYTLKNDYFFGLTDWWVTFENGEEFYLTTQRMGFSLWSININCN